MTARGPRDAFYAAGQLSTYVASVFDPADIVEIRRLPSGVSSWCRAPELPLQAAGLRKENDDGQNIFVGANPRQRAGGTKATDVAVARCLFADSDGVTVDENSQPVMQEYHNHGFSIIDAFVKGEFCEANRGTTFVAHNAKGYDAQFIKESCSRQGIQYKYIPNGCKIMELQLVGLGIRIIDSANFIAARLSAFPKMFGLSNVRKGTYPYAFNTLENWTYKGVMPPKQLFLPHGSDGVEYKDGEELKKYSELDIDNDNEMELLHARVNIIKWWNEKVCVLCVSPCGRIG